MAFSTEDTLALLTLLFAIPATVWTLNRFWICFRRHEHTRKLEIFRL